MVNLTINGQSVQVPEGTTVLRAAESAGIFIPTLCDHKELIPYGGCRMCLVEVEGFRTLQPSCTLPVANNMVVRTESEKIKAARKFVLTLIFSERNHFCPYCQVSGGDCELQNAAYREGMTHWPLSPNYQPFAMDASHPYIVMENNRCILCRRCVRACSDLVGNFTLGFEERGAASFLVADYGVPLGESTCISCGTCVQVCPTGALIDRMSAYRGKVVQVDRVQTICVGCSVGCGMEVLTRDNNLVRIEGDWSAPINNGLLCEVGRFTPTGEQRTRINTPLVRKNGSLKAATWDEALEFTASQLKPLMGNPKAGVAALASTRMTLEALSLFKNLFADKFGSDTVTSIEEGMPTAVTARLAEKLGKPFEASLDDLRSADCVLTMGVDLHTDHQVAGFFVKRAQPQGTKLIVVDPAENRWDAIADVTLKFKKGTDQDVLKGLSAAISAGELSDYVKSTGIEAESFSSAAQLLAAAQKPMIVLGKGITGQNSMDLLQALLDFATSCNAKILTVKGQANSLGAALYNLDQPFTLNGHKAAVLALGDDEPSQRLAQKLETRPFLVVFSSYQNLLTAQADVVLPVTTWLEQEGHYLSMDGRLQKANRSLQPGEEVWTSEQALLALAEKLGFTLDQDWQANLKERTPAVPIKSV